MTQAEHDGEISLQDSVEKFSAETQKKLTSTLDQSVFEESTDRHSISLKLRVLLRNTKVREITQQSLIYGAGENETIGSIFSKLISASVLSLPVFNEDKTFLGFIDILDILTYLAVSLEPGKAYDRDWWSTWHKLFEVSRAACSEIINFSKRNPSVFVDSETSLQRAIDVLGPHNVHRVAVLKDNTGYGILTQTKILEWLNNRNFDELGNISLMTVDEIKLGYKKVYTTTLKTIAFDAFREMVAHEVSGLAIVDDVGAIVGNLSATDLKLIGYDMGLYGKLFRTVSEIKSWRGKIESPLTVLPSTTFKEVLYLFQSFKVHRLFVVDHKGILLGVITPADVVRCFQTNFQASI